MNELKFLVEGRGSYRTSRSRQEILSHSGCLLKFKRWEQFKKNTEFMNVLN